MKTSCNVAENGGGSYRLLAILRWVMKLPSAALIAAAMFATPAVARTSHVTSRHRAMDANASASPTARYIDGRVGLSARASAPFPRRPAAGAKCDVRDHPRIC